MQKIKQISARVKILTVLFSILWSASFGQDMDTIFTASENPFSTQTTLSIYELDNDTVSLSVLDATGKLVAFFYKTKILSNTVDAVFKADSLEDGVYFAKLDLNTETYTLKLIKSEYSSIHSYTGENQVNIDVFPNPTKRYVDIHASEAIQQVELINTQGQKVFINKNNSLNKLDLMDVKKGTYFLHVHTAKGLVVKKIMKD
jgi:hypothetical protein